MSNTGTLRPTSSAQAGSFAAALVSQAGVFLSAAILTICVISFRPFQPAGVVIEGGAPRAGDVVNQLGFSVLGAIAIFGILCFAQPRRISALFSPWWLLMLAVMLFSTQVSMAPSIVFRSYVFTVLGMVAIMAAVALPRDADGFATALATMSIIVLTVCYLGVFLYSSVAVHGFDVYEPQHSGFWRGSFAHKNVAGPVMAFLSYIGFYLYRRGWRAIGAGIFVGAIFFLLQTGSKTTAGLVPAAILAVALPGLMGLRWLTAVGFILAMIVTAVGTLGIEFIPPFKAYITENMPDFTYTGRTQLWRFVSELIAQRPWTGFGFESVWGSPTVRDTYPAFDQTWDVRGIVNAHNGYLDIAVTMGLPALALACIAMMIVPAIDYLRVPKRRENIYLSDLFMMMIFFGAQNAFLESFFFKRAEPVWLLFFLAAFGMRYAARFPLSAHGEK